MSLYTKQKFFCNNCGKELLIEWTKMLGRNFKVCSKECAFNLEEKRLASILGFDEPKLMMLKIEEPK